MPAFADPAIASEGFDLEPDHLARHSGHSPHRRASIPRPYLPCAAPPMPAFADPAIASEGFDLEPDHLARHSGHSPHRRGSIRGRYLPCAARRSTKVLPPFILSCSGASMICTTTFSMSAPACLATALLISSISAFFCSSVRPAAMWIVTSGILVSLCSCASDNFLPSPLVGEGKAKPTSPRGDQESCAPRRPGTLAAPWSAPRLASADIRRDPFRASTIQRRG